ncbi:MAG: hypothetical protein ACE361_15530 [Aureliella sp.]
MLAFSIWLLFLFTGQDLGERFSEPDAEDEAIVSDLVNGITENRAEFGKFAVVVDAEGAKQAFRDDIKSSVFSRRYVQVYDEEYRGVGARRVDEHTESGIDYGIARTPWRTLVQSKTIRRQYISEHLLKEYDSLKAPLDHDPPGSFDPWSLPLANPFSLANGKVDSNYESLVCDLNRLHSIAYPSNQTVVRFKIKSVFYDVTFDKRYGNMPTRCAWLRNEGTSVDLDLRTFCTIDTRWEKRSDGWVPLKVSHWFIVGDAARPNVQIEQVMEFAWLFDQRLPVGVFDPEKIPGEKLVRSLRIFESND